MSEGDTQPNSAERWGESWRMWKRLLMSSWRCFRHGHLWSQWESRTSADGQTRDIRWCYHCEQPQWKLRGALFPPGYTHDREEMMGPSQLLFRVRMGRAPGKLELEVGTVSLEVDPDVARQIAISLCSYAARIDGMGGELVLTPRPLSH